MPNREFSRLVAASILALCGEFVSTPAVGASDDTKKSVFQWEFSSITDHLQNRSGGLGRGERLMSHLAVAGRLDGERHFDLRGLELFGSVHYTSGGGISIQYVGDIQGISNIDAREAWRLYELGFQWQSRAGSWLFGLYDLNSEFDVSDVSALFLNSSHGIGADIALSGSNGPSIFPVTGLAVRYAHHLNDLWQFKVAALDAVPGDLEHPSRFVDIHLSPEEGALFAAEMIRVSNSNTVRAGAWSYTKSQERTDGQGVSRSRGMYVGVDRAIADGWHGFGRVGVSSERVNPVAGYAALGIVRKTRNYLVGDVSVGVALNYASISRDWRQIMRANGFAVPGREANVELTARFEITPWLAVQPDIQYVLDPVEALGKDALALGIRFELQFAVTN